MGVLVGAVVVMVMPSDPHLLDIKVIQGSVGVDISPFHRYPPRWVRLNISLDASNPITNRWAAWFKNISMVINASDDGNESMPSRLNIDGGADSLQSGQEMYIRSVQSTDDPVADMGDYFVKKLCRRENIDVTMRIEGTLVLQMVGMLNGGGGLGQARRNPAVTYTCLGITLTVDNSPSYTGADVSCRSIDTRS
ncbi:hypothetical protein E2562_016257 [Oryza meyeriana var. granulata]|uniref:Uncharacterized protein n=1 Tax=Oryza meyeriana var. granulata TaxID=110450 RepID=A0A6G1CQJ9_9ORYZ|nr:hypothetical protein E2562_016257 [Oryza meyeriana var. granulata]